MPTLYLLDGTALAYRSHFAFSRTQLTSSTGQPTGATYGAALFLNALLSREDITHAVCIFDAKGPTFRHEIYPDYKATRQKMPEDLAAQLDVIKEMVLAMGLDVMEMPGYEADDLIGTIAKKAAQERFDVFIVSGDKDFGQLVNERIKLLAPRGKGEGLDLIDAAGVKAKWGVHPDQIVDFMGLKGDTSDNVPGVPKVGEKTAAELINQFGSLEEVLSHAQEIPKPALRQNLLEFAEQARLSRKLVELNTDVPVKIELNQFIRRPPDAQKLIEFYKKLGFHSLLDKLDFGKPRPEQQYKTILSPEELEEILPQLKQGSPLSVDLETTSQDPMQAEIVGFSFAVQDHEAWYVPARLGYFPAVDSGILRLGQPVLPETQWLLDRLRPLYEDETIPKCGQNLKYDALVLRCHDVILRGIVCDAMIASYLLDPSRRQHGMDSLSLEFLEYKKIPTSDLIGSGKNQITMAEVPLEKISRYACEDADIARRLCILLKARVEQEKMLDLFEKLELPLIPVLLEMEFNGVALDLKLLAEMSREMGERLEALTQEIYRLAGTEFNINSTQQLAHILFEKLHLKPIKKTKSGYSTDVEVLEELAKLDPLPRTLLEYRQVQKLKSTYVDALPRMINPATGRVHTSFNQTVAATGRLSSSDPNLQNIPIRTELGGTIRKAFIPGGSSRVILSADYSQIELRLVAHISGDENLIAAFHEGKDIHTATAARILRVPEEEVTPELRRSAKEINFGVIYGMGDYGLSSRLSIPLNVAAGFRRQYFETYPGVRTYMERTIEQARRDKFVTTLLGRRRLLPDINSQNRIVRESAERTAINTPIQGTAADMIKLAMIRIHKKLRSSQFAGRSSNHNNSSASVAHAELFPQSGSPSAEEAKSRQSALMILQVHDELVFEVEKNVLEEVKQMVKEEMESAMELKVPVVVELGVGDNWLEAH